MASYMPSPAFLPYNIPQKIVDESVELVVASPKSKRCKFEQIDRLSNLSGKPERMVANWKKILFAGRLVLATHRNHT